MRVLAVALLGAACVETTGGNVVTFTAQAVGTPQARAFATPRGYSVTLSRARLWVGAVYLNQTNPSEHTLETSCVLPGLYSGEVRGGLSIDALSDAEQLFPVKGNGNDSPVRAAELWLADGDINDTDSKTVVLDVAGEAQRDGMSWPFSAAFTIGANRKQQPRDPALPGSRPICKERIVSPIPAELVLAQGGLLTLRVDPRAWFSSVEFKELKSAQFVDGAAEAGQPEVALYNGLKANRGPYSLEWR